MTELRRCALALSILVIAAALAIGCTAAPAGPEDGRAVRAVESPSPGGGPDTSPSPLRIELPPRASAPGGAAEGLSRRLRVGTVRWLPEADRLRTRARRLSWERRPDGQMASLTVASPGARSIRLGLAVEAWPEGAFLQVGGDGDRVHGPLVPEPGREGRVKGRPGTAAGPGVESGSDPGRLFWTPLVNGDSASLELVVPDSAAGPDVRLEVAAVAHVDISPFDGGLRDLGDIGSSADCNQDVACTDAGPERDSVAKLLFVSGLGVYLCTGQLIASPAAGPVNLFTTANHCISTADEARSVDLFWFFQRAVCGGPVPTSVRMTSGGRLLHTADVDTSTDLTLLQLTSRPPRAAVRSPWSTTTPENSSPIRGIHHPSGDLKKASEGIVSTREPWSDQEFDSHVRVYWSEGVTEGGSSGSGLWHDGELIGVLTGGGSSCRTPGAPDLYGRFDLTYPDMRGWLDPESLERLGSDRRVRVRGQVGAGGWIHYRIPGGTDTTVRIRLRPRSGDPDLYVHRQVAPGLDKYQCRSSRGEGAVDRCVVDLGRNDAYIGVHGYTEADFVLVIRRRPSG